MKVVALFRVSTDTQQQRGASLATQESRFDEIAQQRGWNVVARLRGAESATRDVGDRQVLTAALEAIRVHEAQAIYVHEPSRLTRGDELAAAMLLRELRERGCRVLVQEQERDVESIDGRFVWRIEAAVSAAEVERIRERSMRGRHARARQGRWFCGSAPLGYRNPPPGDPRRGTLQIDPGEAAQVREVFELVLAGHSVNSISRRTGLATTSVRNMVRNPVYAGRLVPHRHSGRPIEPTDGAHEPIVSPEDWQRAQAALSRRSVPLSGRRTLLGGMLSINGERAESDSNCGRRYYLVHGGPWLQREQVDAAAWAGLIRLVETPQFVAEVEAAIKAEGEAGADRAAAQSAAQARIDRLTARLDRFATMWADNDITRVQHDRLAAEAREDLAHARRALGQIPDQPQNDTLGATIEVLASILGADRPDERRRLLESAVEAVEVRAVDRGADRWIRDGRGRVQGASRTRWAVEAMALKLRVGQMGQEPWFSAQRPWSVWCVVVADSEAVLRFERRGEPVVAAVRRGVGA